MQKNIKMAHQIKHITFWDTHFIAFPSLVLLSWSRIPQRATHLILSTCYPSTGARRSRPWLHRIARVSQTPITAALTGWSAPVRMSPYRSSCPSPAPWSISASRPPSTASWTRRQHPAPSLSTHPHEHLMLKLRCHFLKKRSVYPASKRMAKKLCSQCRRAARVSSDLTDQMYTFREMLLRIPNCNVM